jgi:uncharacterized protein
MTIEGITEQDIADYLAANPAFFERHADVLSAIQFQHPMGHRTVSLQERQALMLRERIKGLERRIIDMIRNGQENIGHFDKLQAWTLAQMKHADPETLQLGLRELFLIPVTALRLFGSGGGASSADWAQPVSDDLRRFAEGLAEPYCGPNEGFEASHWCEGSVASLAMVPLRKDDGTCFGLLVLASPDAARYSADKGLEFLHRVGEVASLALAPWAPQSA